MKVQSISLYSPKLNSLQNRTSISLNVSSPFKTSIGDTVSFSGSEDKGKTSFIDVGSYVFIGGKCKFAKASLSKIGYTGALFSNFDGIRTESFYRNGEKEQVVIKGDDESKESTSVALKRCESEELPEGGLNVFYRNKNNDITFIENYDPNGNLCQTEYIKEDREGKTACFMRTTYAEDGLTVLGSETIVNPEYALQTGYERKVVTCQGNGKIAKKTMYHSIDSDHLSEVATILYDKNGVPVRKEEDEIYFADSPDSTFYSTRADRRRTIYSKNKSIDYGFRTLNYNTGLNPLRKAVFEEHLHTIRVTENNEVVYYDELTKVPYAAESYEEGSKIPSIIANFDDNTYAKKTSVASNIASYEILDKNDRRIAVSVFRKCGDDYVLAGIDGYDSIGRIDRRTRFYNNDTKITTYYDNGNMTRKEEHIAGVLKTVNEYEGKELARQTKYLDNGEKSVIEIAGPMAEEWLYRPDAEEPYCGIYYENDIPYQKVTFDPECGTRYMEDYSDDKHNSGKLPKLYIRALK